MRLSRKTRQRRGFTAVEIAMVATVIAILALLVLPIFRSRAEEARLVAAKDELATFAKSLQLVEADIGGTGGDFVFLPQLNGLDAPTFEVGQPITAGYDQFLPPRIFWNRQTGQFDELQATDAAEAAVYDRVLLGWRGPYVATPSGSATEQGEKLIPLTDLATPFFAPLTTAGTGVLFVPADATYQDDAYPLDPWGTPYLLYGPETSYTKSVVLSLGPNGVPGNVPGATFVRTDGILGTGDDLKFEF